MSDLISRSALIKAFEAEERECEDAGMVPSWWSAYKIIKEQLTAFDVDKVVVDMEERRANFNCKLCRHYHNGKGKCCEDCTDALIEDLFDIMKRGGIDG